MSEGRRDFVRGAFGAISSLFVLAAIWAGFSVYGLVTPGGRFSPTVEGVAAGVGFTLAAGAICLAVAIAVITYKDLREWNDSTETSPHE